MDHVKAEAEGVLYWEDLGREGRKAFFEAMRSAGRCWKWAAVHAPKTIPEAMRAAFAIGVARAMVAEAAQHGDFGWI